jgi:hypothetical protein
VENRVSKQGVENVYEKAPKLRYRKLGDVQLQGGEVGEDGE